ncbi:YncE family protein [Kitasatospora sp. NPDC056327]|uniref:YncE family protein n=1 Tax=Kitasatospora sp. NPDC056327 TaxID=3345785 RepID=UPI0035E06D50
MNSLVSKARWLSSLVIAGVLLVAGAGTAGARTDDGGAGPVRGVPRVVQLGAGGQSVAVSPDGRRAYVSTASRGRGAGLAVVDTQSGAVTAHLLLSGGYYAVAGGVAVSPDGSRVYVLYGTGYGTPVSLLGVVDTATNTLVAGVAPPAQTTPPTFLPGNLDALTVSADGSRVYVTQFGPSAPQRPTQAGTRVLQFDTGPQAFTGAVTLPGAFTGSVVARPGGGDVYVAAGGLTHLDTSGGSPVVANTNPAVGGSFAGLALSPDDTRLFGVDGAGRGFTVDLATDAVTASYAITPGRWLRTLSVNAAGTRLYTLTQDGSLLAIDTATNAVAPGEGVPGLNASDVALGPDGHTFYAVSVASLRIIGF